MNNPLATELTLLTRLIYSNKNQHHAAIWFRRATEVKRWTRKLLQQQQQTTTTTTITFLDQVIKGLRLYHSKLSKDRLHGHRNHIHSLLCQDTLNH